MTPRAVRLVPLAVLLAALALLPTLWGDRPAPRISPALADEKPVKSVKLLSVEGLLPPRRPALARPRPGRQVRRLRPPLLRETRPQRTLLPLARRGRPDKAEAMEDGEPDARSPVFSPDGKWIAFLSTRARPKGWKQTPPVPPQSDPATDVWLIPAAGGPAIPLAGPEKPYGRVFNDGFYGRLSFSRDGKKLAFVADDGSDPRTEEEIGNRRTDRPPRPGRRLHRLRPRPGVGRAPRVLQHVNSFLAPGERLEQVADPDDGFGHDELNGQVNRQIHNSGMEFPLLWYGRLARAGCTGETPVPQEKTALTVDT